MSSKKQKQNRDKDQKKSTPQDVRKEKESVSNPPVDTEAMTDEEKITMPTEQVKRISAETSHQGTQENQSQQASPTPEAAPTTQGGDSSDDIAPEKPAPTFEAATDSVKGDDKHEYVAVAPMPMMAAMPVSDLKPAEPGSELKTMAIGLESVLKKHFRRQSPEEIKAYMSQHCPNFEVTISGSTITLQDGLSVASFEY